MHPTIALLALAPLALASFADLKEGVLYISTNYPNGTTIHEELENPGTFVALHKRDYDMVAKRRAARAERPSGPNVLQARAGEATTCLSPMLNRESVDHTVQSWKNFLTQAGSHTLVSEDRSRSISYFGPSSFTYYCIDVPRTKGNIDLNDLNKALSKMDSKCYPYQASWYRWANSNEIFGKSRTGDKVCCGPEGQYC